MVRNNCVVVLPIDPRKDLLLTDMSSSVDCPIDGEGKQALRPSTSTIILADIVKGSHVLTINGYSWLKGLSKAAFFNSILFNIDGYSWFITYCPDGLRIINTNCISLYVTLAHTFDILVDHDTCQL